MGFDLFFLSAAIFVGVAIPAWIWLLAGAEGVPMHYRLREWHMHEMVFGFLSCVITRVSSHGSAKLDRASAHERKTPFAVMVVVVGGTGVHSSFRDTSPDSGVD